MEIEKFSNSISAELSSFEFSMQHDYSQERLISHYSEVIQKVTQKKNTKNLVDQVVQKIESGQIELSKSVQIHQERLINVIRSNFVESDLLESIEGARLSSESNTFDTIEDIESYFSHLKDNIEIDLANEEVLVKNDQDLSDDEKVAIIAALNVVNHQSDLLIDDALTEIKTDEAINSEGGRVEFFKRIVNTFKKVVNVIVTSYPRMAANAIIGALVGSGLGPIGVGTGAWAGVAFGFLQGLDCYFGGDFCGTCLFCIESDQPTERVCHVGLDPRCD